MPNELSDRAEVPGPSRSLLSFVSDKGEIELGESRSSRHGPAHVPRPPWFECKVQASWKRHGQRHEHRPGPWFCL